MRMHTSDTEKKIFRYIINVKKWRLVLSEQDAIFFTFQLLFTQLDIQT